MDAVEGFVNEVAAKPNVRFVSFRQLVNWLELQDPDVLTELHGLGADEAPDNWA
jgi:hypothetical protein